MDRPWLDRPWITRVSPPAKYRPVAARYRQLIESGELPIGSRLPPIDDVAGSFGVGRHVVTQAWRELALLGLIDRTVPKSRPIVASNTPRSV